MSPKRAVRIVEPDHQQIGWRFDDPELTLRKDHPARMLFDVVKTLDLSMFTRDAKAVEGRPGRTVRSPAMKLVLWLYALSQGIGSAREIERLIGTDAAFGWICRGLTVSHHALSKFRVAHGEALEKLMVDVLAVLLHKGLVSLERVAQDGTRIRASASAPSFRGMEGLENAREQADLHLKAVLAESDGTGAKVGKAIEFKERVDEAIATLKRLQQAPRHHKTRPVARVSTTDPDARVMKMADGGFRPGYNFQFAVAGSEEGGPRTIVGFRVTNIGSDVGSVTPMIRNVARNTGRFPMLWLADANHVKHSCIEYAQHVGVSVLMAVPKRELSSKAKVPDAVLEWRKRMTSEEARRIYRSRAGLVELINAHTKTRLGVDALLVRGLEKVTCVGLLVCLASNILQHGLKLLA